MHRESPWQHPVMAGSGFTQGRTCTSSKQDPSSAARAHLCLPAAEQATLIALQPQVRCGHRCVAWSIRADVGCVPVQSCPGFQPPAVRVPDSGA